MQEVNESGIKPESKFNQGMVKVYRMNEIRMGLHQARERGDSKTFFKLLKSWRSELNFKMDEKERTAADNHEKKIMTTGKGNTQFNMFMGNTNTEYTQLDDSLYRYELFLGDVEKNTGLGSPDKDDDEGL